MKYAAITQAAIEMLAASTGGSERERLGKLRTLVEAKHPGAIARARVRIDKEKFDSKFIGPVPDWAKRYVAKYGNGRVDTLQVRQSQIKTYTSGHCYGTERLVVTFSKPGSDLVEQKATVLHEIAHSLAPYDGHGDRFYRKWYEMLRAENLYRSVIVSGRFVGVSSLKNAARRQRAKRAT